MSEPVLSDIGQIINQCMNDSSNWFPEKAFDIPFLALALGGEVGELQNLVKKVERGDFTYQAAEPRIVEEAIDAFIYLCGIFGALNVDVATEYNNKREHNNKRFGHAQLDR